MGHLVLMVIVFSQFKQPVLKGVVPLDASAHIFLVNRASVNKKIPLIRLLKPNHKNPVVKPS
jgi:hypothetical protein